jgi:ribosomal protein S18 acetylase RimI-like enzyme
MLPSSISIGVEDPATDDARWCIQQYFAELAERFETGFDPERSIPADAADLRPPSGLLLLARRGEQPLGCGALKFHPGEPAELKRMWVSPEARGLGLGRRLLRSLEQAASEAGVTAIRLETNGTLSEAIALYRKAGYAEVAAFNSEPYAHHWFEKHL